MFTWLPRLYPLTDVSLSELSHNEQVAQLIEGGATLIQLREKGLSARDFYQQAESALKVARSRGAKIIINDRVDLALMLGADGVHLGQDDLPPEFARQLLGSAAIIGFSTHSLDQAKRATDLPIDYLAIGPVFSTKTKSNTAPEVGLEGVRQVKKIAGSIPVVAIGGITEERTGEVLAAGADSVAVISAVLCDPAGVKASTTRLLASVKQI